MARNGKFGIGILLEAKNQVSGPANAAAESMKGVAKTVSVVAKRVAPALKKMAQGALAMKVGFEGLKILAGLANNAGLFAQEMAATGVIMGVTRKELSKLEQVATRAGLATQFSPLQAAQTMRSLGQAGLTAKQAIDTLRPSLDLAAASLGSMEPALAGKTLNATLKTFGLSADQSRLAMNSLVNMTNKFNIGVEDLPIAIGNVARGAIALRQDMDSTLVTLGLVKNILPDVSSAATLTSSAMLRVADKKIQKKLEKLGVAFKDQKGNFLPIIEIFNNFNQVIKKKFIQPTDQAAKVTEIFGKRAIAPFAAVTVQLDRGVKVAKRFTEGMKNVGFDKKTGLSIVKGAQAIKFMQLQFKASRGEIDKIPKSFIGLRKEAARVRKEVGKTGGAGDIFVKTLLDTFKGQIDLMKGAVESFLNAIGKPLIQVFRPFVTIAKNAFTSVANIIVAMNPKLKTLFAFLAAGTLVATTLVGAFLALSGAFSLVSLGITTFVLPFILPVIALLKSVAVGVLLLTGALILLKAMWTTDWLAIRSIVFSVWSGIKSGFNTVFVPLLNTWLPLLKDAFMQVWGTIQTIMVQTGLAGQGSAASLITVFVWLGKIVGFVLGVILGAIVGIGIAIGKVIGWVVSLVSWVIGLFRTLLGFFGLIGKVSPKFAKIAKAGKVSSAAATPGKLKGTTATPAPSKFISGGAKVPTPAVSIPASFQRQTQQQTIVKNVTLRGNVTIDGKVAGSILASNQRNSTQKGLIRSTTKEA